MKFILIDISSNHETCMGPIANPPQKSVSLAFTVDNPSISRSLTRPVPSGTRRRKSTATRSTTSRPCPSPMVHWTQSWEWATRRASAPPAIANCRTVWGTSGTCTSTCPSTTSATSSTSSSSSKWSVSSAAECCSPSPTWRSISSR